MQMECERLKSNPKPFLELITKLQNSGGIFLQTSWNQKKKLNPNSLLGGGKGIWSRLKAARQKPLKE